MRLTRPFSICEQIMEIGSNDNSYYGVLVAPFLISGSLLKTYTYSFQKIEIGQTEVWNHDTSTLIPYQGNISVYETVTGWEIYRVSGVGSSVTVSNLAGYSNPMTGYDWSGYSYDMYGYNNAKISATTVTATLLKSGSWNLRYPLIIDFEPELSFKSIWNPAGDDTIEGLGIKFLTNGLTDYTSGPYWRYGNINVEGWTLKS